MAQWLHAMMLVRCREPADAEAMGLLQQALTRIDEHKMLVSGQGPIEADLVGVSPRDGRSDDQIERLRSYFNAYIANGSPLVEGINIEVLIRLLLERGAADDLAEAHAVITKWEARQIPAPIPGLDLWRLRCRAMVTKAERNTAAYAEIVRQYRELAERLGARGELLE